MRIEAVRNTGITPLEYMLKVMRSSPPKRPPNATAEQLVAHEAKVSSHEAKCFEAAKASARYMHPTLQAIEHTGPDGGAVPVELNLSDACRRILFLLSKEAAARS